MDEERLYYLAFSTVLGIGPVKFSLLLKHFKTAQKAYEAKAGDLKELLGDELARKFTVFRQEFNPAEKLKEYSRKNIAVLCQKDKLFPQLLLSISDPPICLYIKGNLDLFDFVRDYFIAIVGTRRPTSYGQQVAKKFAIDLTSCGFTIVSGMAMGIDTVAHIGAISSGGRTIAVLGCGVDIVYPPINQKLYERIVEDRGIVISEFPPGHTVRPGLFIARNRLISGLSRGVLVVEGAQDSGALITARYAAEQGKEVFAPPAPITSSLSAAPNLLLKQGAKLVTSVEDILDELNLKIQPAKKEKMSLNLNEEESNIFEILLSEPLIVDDISVKINKEITTVLQVLSSLELKGAIEKNSEGRYQIKD